jgi:hypothetical protein
MDARIIEWDGTNLPDELRLLPPGRYLLEPFDGWELSEEEDAAVSAAIDELESGTAELIPFDEVTRELRSRFDRE